MSDDNDYRRVTVGEVARRLDEQREDFRDFKREVLEAIHALQYVPRDEYEAREAATNDRLEKLERFKDQAQDKPARTLRELVTGLAYPALIGCLGAIAAMVAKAKGIA